ncbi:MAG: type II toxin-antitoxin system HicA family toxin [Deltaproteobacteria bacterium]|nr:type II toxin-antitoxin system HicA family toxin [Deltaproteobacteria bacterium]
MPRLTALHWKKLVCVFEKDGFRKDRERGDHIVMVKSGVARPVIIPKYSEVGIDIIKSNMRTACMSRERFFDLVKDC